jgi:predicted esterase
LDAARSVYKLADKESIFVSPDESIFLAGFSQGGHAALSAKDFSKKYAPDLPIKGIITYSPATNVTELLKEAPALGPYLFHAYADFYGKGTIDPQKVLQPKWLPTLEQDVTSICVDKIYKYYGYSAKEIYNDTFYNALFNNNLESEFPEFKKALDENTTGFEKSDIPVVVFQGATDNIVTAKTVRGVTRKLCESGNNVYYQEYSDIDHFKIRQISYRDTLKYMQSVLSNNPPASNCQTL